MVEFLNLVLIGIPLGLLFRILWANFVEHKKLYYVPYYWVLTALVLTIITAPSATPFVIGVFLLDLLYFAVKEDEVKRKAFSKKLNKVLKGATDEA
jgi:hypothetical protein